MRDVKVLGRDEMETLYSKEELAALEREVESRETAAEKATRTLFDEMNEKFAQKTGSIILSRHAGWHSTLEHLETFPSDKFDEPEKLYDYIRYQWGAGEYRIQGRIDGQKGYALNKAITIGKTKEELLEEKRGNNLPAVIPKNSDDRMMLMMMDFQRRQDERFAAIMRQMEAQRSNPLREMMTPEVTTALITGGLALIGNMMNRPRSSSIEEALAIIKLSKEMKDSDNDEKSNTIMEAVGAIAGGLMKGVSDARTERKPKSLAPPQPSAASAIAAAKQHAESVQKWDAENVAEYIEALAEQDAEIQDDHVQTVLTMTENDYVVISNAFCIMFEDAYQKVKPKITEKFNIPEAYLKAIEEKRAENAAQEKDENEASDDK